MQNHRVLLSLLLVANIRKISIGRIWILLGVIQKDSRRNKFAEKSFNSDNQSRPHHLNQVPALIAVSMVKGGAGHGDCMNYARRRVANKTLKEIVVMTPL